MVPSGIHRARADGFGSPGLSIAWIFLLVLYSYSFNFFVSQKSGDVTRIDIIPKGLLEIGSGDGFTWEKEAAWRWIAEAGETFRTQREASRTEYGNKICNWSGLMFHMHISSTLTFAHQVEHIPVLTVAYGCKGHFSKCSSGQSVLNNWAA